MWLVTYFLITIIHKITEAESVQKHIGKNCLLDLCITIIQKDGGHFQHENHFLDSFLQAILMILVSNHTFLTMQNLNFDLQDLNVNPGNNCPCSATQPYTCNCIVWCKPDQSGVIYTTHDILICSHI